MTYYYSYSCYSPQPKRKGVAIANLLRCQGTSSSSPKMVCVRDFASKGEPVVTTNFVSSLFSHRMQLNMLFMFCQIFYLFLNNSEGELISLEHCSIRNRKILRHIVHTLKFLAWLSRIVKHNTPKLVAQACLQQLRSDHDLSKVFCVEENNNNNNNKRIVYR